MAKFIVYDPSLLPPAFSDNARIEIKNRSGAVQTCWYEPWTLVGWNHTGGPLDILEFRLLRGTMTKQKPVPPKVEMPAIESDARMFCGLPPHSGSNPCAGDGYFDNACRAKYGEAAWAAACESVRACEKQLREMATSIKQVNEIAARRGLPIKVAGAERDPNVELKALLKEVIDVLHCHHRNTHKSLLARLREYRSSL